MIMQESILIKMSTRMRAPIPLMKPSWTLTQLFRLNALIVEPCYTMKVITSMNQWKLTSHTLKVSCFPVQNVTSNLTMECHFKIIWISITGQLTLVLTVQKFLITGVLWQITKKPIIQRTKNLILSIQKPL